MSSASASGARLASPAGVLTALVILLILICGLFMTVGVRGNWSFVLSLRGARLLQMLLVAYAVAVSTVLFQTVTNNRILTPSIMGFDAAYVLIQTSLVFALGSLAVDSFDPRLLFGFEVVVMTGFALLLFRWLFGGGIAGLHLMLLVGIVFGTFFRSLSGFMQRLIDPNEFVVLQDRFFANFGTVNTPLLTISAVFILAASLAGWRIRHAFDVLALGRETAINLGVPYRRMVTGALVIIAVLVSVSTALVGPITFFGLLVANLAYRIVPSHRHAAVLPGAALVAGIALVGGQLILERVFAFDTALAVIIEFLGGILFITLLLKGRLR
jgi:iron complex transport system permease protein